MSCPVIRQNGLDGPPAGCYAWLPVKKICRFLICPLDIRVVRMIYYLIQNVHVVLQGIDCPVTKVCVRRTPDFSPLLVGRDLLARLRAGRVGLWEGVPEVFNLQQSSSSSSLTVTSSSSIFYLKIGIRDDDDDDDDDFRPKCTCAEM